jgi:hypothetical protein
MVRSESDGLDFAGVPSFTLGFVGIARGALGRFVLVATFRCAIDGGAGSLDRPGVGSLDCTRGSPDAGSESMVVIRVKERVHNQYVFHPSAGCPVPPPRIASSLFQC